MNINKLKEGAMFYDVIKEGEVIFRGTPAMIKSKYQLTNSNWTLMLQRGSEIKGMILTEYSRLRMIYEARGITGDREEIAKELNVTESYVRGLISTKGVKVGWYFEAEGIRHFIGEEVKPKEEEPTEVAAIYVYDSPNKAYVDSLFDSTFKGWRA